MIPPVIHYLEAIVHQFSYTCYSIETTWIWISWIQVE